MSLQRKIQADLKESMIQKNEAKRDLLRVVVGEMSREKYQEVQDSRVVTIIKNMIENARIVGNTNEIAILETYLPTQLDDTSLKQEIIKIIGDKAYTNIKEMGKVMADLKAKYPGQYDGQVASKIVKECFA